MPKNWATGFEKSVAVKFILLYSSHLNLKHVLSTVCSRNWAQMREQPQHVMENLDDTAVFFDVCKSLEGKYSFGEGS